MMWAIDNLLKKAEKREREETRAVVRLSELAVFVAFRLIEI